MNFEIIFQKHKILDKLLKNIRLYLEVGIKTGIGYLIYTNIHPI
jgi:hypothetical protein